MESMEISKILAETNEKGKFLSCIVTDIEGFPIASVSTADRSPEVQAAVVGLIQRVISQASEQLGISDTTEFSLFDASGNLFVCRPFITGGVEMVLAFLIPGKDQPYRRLMSQTITKIQQFFEL
jgi:hypothetical protein